MIEDLLRNMKTLQNAIGKEPIGQILGNALRKAVGLDPVLKNEKIDYKKYCAQRATKMRARQLKEIENISVSIIWVVNTLNIEKLKTTHSSMQQQRLTSKEILLVCDNNTLAGQLSMEASYATLKEARKAAQGEYICLVHNTPYLYDTYIQELAWDVYHRGAVEILYTCSDTRDEDALRTEPQFKPELNLDLLYANNYIGQQIFYKASYAEALRGFDTTVFPEAYVYDFLLRAAEKGARIRRVAEVLYGDDPLMKPESLGTCKQVLSKHLGRAGRAAQIVDGQEEGTMRVNYHFQENPAVSIIIPYKDKVELLQQCVESILTRTAYKNYEIILVDNGSTQGETIRYGKKLSANRLNIHLLRLEMDFNFSALNNAAVATSKSEFLLFLNNDTRVINRDWLTAMVRELQRPEVGAVGAKLLYEDGTVQHAGVIYGLGHVAGHSFRTLDDEDGGHMQRANLTQEYLAVTGACLMTKRALFNRLGGFDAQNLGIAYNDIDYCLAVHQLGYKVIYTPYARLFHYESKSRASDLSDKERDRYDKERIFMLDKWQGIYETDPFFHPHLDDSTEDFRIRGNV